MSKENQPAEGASQRAAKLDVPLEKGRPWRRSRPG